MQVLDGNTIPKACHFLQFIAETYVYFLISKKISVCAYLSTLKAGTMFRSFHTGPFGQSQKTTTMTHGFVYNNKLTVKKQIILRFIQVCTLPTD